MPPTVMMQFADRLVTYETFMSDKRPGKVEYCMADLRLLQRTEQDYLNQ